MEHIIFPARAAEMVQLSIIIPNYNYGHFIQEALDSILNTNQKQDYEIIVIDDGSTDNSREILKNYPQTNRFKTYYQDKNLGAAHTINHGLRLAKGDYLHFFASDDIHQNGTIDEMLSLIEEHPSIPLFCADHSFFSSNGRISTIASLPLSTMQFFNAKQCHFLFKHTDFWVPGHTIFVKKEIYQQYGEIDAAWGPLCDWIINHQIALKEGVAYLPKSLVAMRQHGDSLNTHLSIASKKRLWVKLLNESRTHPTLHRLGKSGLFRMLGIKAIQKELLFNPLYWKYALPILRKIVEKACFKPLGINHEHFWLKKLPPFMPGIDTCVCHSNEKVGCDHTKNTHGN